MSQSITIILHPEAIAILNRLLKKAKDKKV